MKRVVMIGPSPSAKGGMASVIGVLLRNGYVDVGDCVFIPTHISGNRWQKALLAASSLLRLAGLLVRGQVSLLHAHVASDASFWRKSAFIVLARVFSCPVIFHLHSGEFPLFLSQRLNSWQRWFAHRVMRSSRCAFVLCHSAGTLLEQVGIGRVELMPNPIEIPRAVPPRLAGKDVLFLGRLDDKKGVYDLLRAFPALLAEHPQARLVLAGEGEVDQVRQLARELGIDAALELPGWIDAQQRTDLLAQAGAFVLPSRFEQMPMVVLEAMVAGTPVVATKVGAVDEMLEQGDCGVLVDVGSPTQLAAALIEVLGGGAQVEQRALRAQARVRTVYAVDVVLATLRRYYEELKR